VQRLHKSRKDKVLDGVCGGIGIYFDVDTVIIRIIWVLATIFSAGGFGILAYLIAMVIIPREPGHEKPSSDHHKDYDHDPQHDDGDSVERIDEIVLKEEEDLEGNNNNGIVATTEERKNKFSLLLGLLLIIFGGILLLERFLGISLRSWFYDIQMYLWPLLLIGLGVFLLSRRSAK
jgi:phage shock protein C